MRSSSHSTTTMNSRNNSLSWFVVFSKWSSNSRRSLVASNDQHEEAYSFQCIPRSYLLWYAIGTQQHDDDHFLFWFPCLPLLPTTILILLFLFENQKCTAAFSCHPSMFLWLPLLPRWPGPMIFLIRLLLTVLLSSLDKIIASMCLEGQIPAMLLSPLRTSSMSQLVHREVGCFRFFTLSHTYLSHSTV